MSGFPGLKPAFTAHLHLAPPSQVGALNSGPSIVHVSFLPGTGQVKSEPSYDVVPPLDAEFLHGADYLRIDPDGAHTRLDVDSLVRDKATGALLRYKYSGTVDMRGGAGKVLRGEDAGSKTPGWGEICKFHISGGLHADIEPTC